MKKRILSLALALTVALSCAPFAGAAVSSSDAQMYYQLCERNPHKTPYLVDFDGDGKDELLLVWDYDENHTLLDTIHYEVWHGDKIIASSSSSSVWLRLSKNNNSPGKLFLCDDNGAVTFLDRTTYTVSSGRWIKVDTMSADYDWGDLRNNSFSVNGKTVDESSFMKYYEAYKISINNLISFGEDPVYRQSTRASVMVQLFNSIDTSRSLKDVLSSLSSRQKTAIFDELLCPFAGYDIDFRTASEKAIVDVMHNVWYDHDKQYDFGFDRSLTYHEGLSKAKLDTVTTKLFGRTINLAPFARNSEPDPEDMASYCFSYKNALYFHAYFGMGSFPGYIDTVPLHLYHIGNDYYCAIQKELWYEDGGSLCDHYIYSSVIKKNADGNWQLVRLYPNNHVPTAEELSAFVAPSSWAKAEVEAADQAGLIPDLTGDPGWQDASTRLQFCQLAVQLAETALGETLPAAPANTFTDCSDLAVRKAYAAKIVNGMTETTFSPNGTLTREQLATMLWRAVNYIQTQSGEQALTGGGSLTGYTDAGSVSSYAKEAVSALNKNGIMKGTSNTALSPKGSCTVEQSVLLSYRTFLKLN